MAIMINEARFNDHSLVALVLAQLGQLDDDGLKNILISIQHIGPNGAFLVGELISIVRARNAEIGALACQVIESVGFAGLPYFPSNETGDSIAELRNKIEASGGDNASIFLGIPIKILKQFAYAFRLFHDGTCGSFRAAESILRKRYPNEKGWSARPLREAAEKLEDRLTFIFGRTVVLCSRKKSNSVKMTDESLKILEQVEGYLTSVDID